MTSFIPVPVPGHVVPGTSSKEIQVRKPWGWQTYILRSGDIIERPGGPSIKKEPVAQPAPVKPKQIGDEQHHGLMQKLGALLQQNVSQMTEAMPSDRLWR